MERRTLIRNMGSLLLTPTFATNHLRQQPSPALRVAHLTDIHLKDEWDAPSHFRRCLRHLQSLTPAVNLVLNGGDIVFDMNKENLSTLNAQWKLYHTTLQTACRLPVRYALGNHDIWWNENNKGQALYGKQFSLDQLQLPMPYYSFVQDGWKFIVLDSVHLDIDGTWYIGQLGDDQFHWLENELKATASQQPICVLSHIPILTATLMVADGIVNKWEMLGGDMHTDTARIIRLFYQYPQVKLCLSGHVHLRDKVVYNNVTYLCNGAVSGAWWKGNHRETAPGYGLIDLYPDGSFAEQYVVY